jgi:hypothetical protein
MCTLAPSSRWQIMWSRLRISIPAEVPMSPAVTTPGPVARISSRFGPSTSILIATPLRLSTMSVTSSRTPGTDENSCSTLSICTEVIAAPWSEERSTRRRALPRVRPKPRSSGSATAVAMRWGSAPGLMSSATGRINSCQFFWIMRGPPFLSPSGSGGRRLPRV